MCKSSKIINISNCQNQNSNKDELFEIDIGAFIKDLESGKYKNIKDLLKNYRNEN